MGSVAGHLHGPLALTRPEARPAGVPQAAMIGGAVYVATHPIADEWPLSQRLALLLQTMVSFMKMVSVVSVGQRGGGGWRTAEFLTRGAASHPFHSIRTR